MGLRNVYEDVSGGGVSVGVSGTGIEFTAGACRLWGCSFGRRSLRFGIDAADLLSRGDEGGSVADIALYCTVCLLMVEAAARYDCCSGF